MHRRCASAQKEKSWKTKVVLLGMNKKPPREFSAPLEVSHDHLLVTPPSHFTPQKVRDFVVGFTSLRKRETIVKKILLTPRSVKGKISSGSNLGFRPQIDDLPLNYGIIGENP
jgi:hypothetical protein